ncbi:MULTISPECIES: flagellar export chaperone FliS [Alteromonadaceae]|uniref:flagellar export chaperone FliS n=1 Tax=Alteromonadaceae TaxID=72275 RepID=UPI001C088F97|nr:MULTISPECIES: flagellar export chaperone FliS [Aliiglaciecola]MBU2877983.1 flagellar export chaperone FliS [Aliiglaciecola lipolytica]MDO6709348.1 flagellar export chaperone FliS [Aliiglaciecola sp. 2_MG-2023]MDO6750496.1 flagellar export chaperone FliS [Aliiglaciecola sp. 1_MG-2023]
MALKGINAYKKGNLKQDVASADPHKITLMLMQGALDRMAYGKGCIERRDFEGKSEHLSRVSAILMNLRDTLDLEIGSEVSQNLFNLYDYMIQRVTDANIQNDLKIMDEVINLLLPIKNAWASIPEDAKQEAYEAQRQKRTAVV